NITDGTDAVEDAIIVVKDSEGKEIETETAGVYELAAGTYTYTVSREGFEEVTGTFEVAEEAQEVKVTLNKIEEEVKEQASNSEA
ncbi:PEGA domain-containing protein, partial [Clostridium faecium]